MTKTWMFCAVTGAAATFALTACGSNDESPPPSGSDPTFEVRIENVSDRASLPTPFAPGAWATFSGKSPLFVPGAADDGSGLEALAEDGDPSSLAASPRVMSAAAESGTFVMPEGANSPAPIFPGERYTFRVKGQASAGRLSFATMLVQSNDLFVAPDPDGIELFGADGMPLAERDITDQLLLWDSGTEGNQAPGSGIDQAPRQSGPNTGAGESVVSAYRHATRALPSAGQIASVSVNPSGGAFEITIENISATHGAVTPIAPVFWAIHSSSWSLFSEGMPAGPALEELAEDGSPAGLVAAHTGASGILTIGAQVEPLEGIGNGPAPAMPGERYRFSVTPDASHPFLTLASMVVQSNDAFLAPIPGGVALLDNEGAPRSAADVEADFERLLAVWDAGTEANEVPGAGMHQPARQASANMGPDDPESGVRRYHDATNDLAATGELVSITVESSTTSSDLIVTVTNVSGATPFPTPLTPVAWALHNDSVFLFEPGAHAPEALERLAEDGDPGPLSTMLGNASGVGAAAVANVPVGMSAPGPLLPGASYRFPVTPDASHRSLSLAAMVVQSNDAFIALGPQGVALIDGSGNVRSPREITSDIASALAAWDAGTEANQVGAIGADQPLRQAAPDSGPAEGDGTVRAFDDPVWTYPKLSDLLRVTIAPVN